MAVRHSLNVMSAIQLLPFGPECLASPVCVLSASRPLPPHLSSSPQPPRLRRCKALIPLPTYPGLAPGWHAGRALQHSSNAERSRELVADRARELELRYCTVSRPFPGQKRSRQCAPRTPVPMARERDKGERRVRVCEARWVVRMCVPGTTSTGTCARIGRSGWRGRCRSRRS